MRTLKPLFIFSLVLALAGGLAAAPVAFAQSAQDCQGHAEFGGNPLATPSTTAAQAAAGGDSLRDFALATRDYLNSITTAEELGYAGCINRNEGPWKSGSTYLAALTLDGRVFYNTNDMSTGGRPLNQDIFGAIALAAGLSQAGTFTKPDGGPVQGFGGYAVGYGTTIPFILLAGLDIQESHFATETLPPGDPSIRADQVTDRETLKQFVNEAKDYLLNLVRTNPTGAFGIARSILRRAPWKHNNIYLFVMDANGFTHLHGAFPDRFEFQNPSATLADHETGDLILPQIISAAQSSPDGGFATYNFDDPNDPNDDFNTLKETYAVQVTETVNIPGVGPFTSSFIIGAGIYGEGDDPVVQGCPLPSGVEPNRLATPSVTAAQVEAGSVALRDFALEARDYMESVQRGPELAHNACVVRQEGPWRSGDTYLVTINTEGRVFFHAAKAALGGRPLKRTVYGTILRALGITATSPTDIRAALANAVATGSFPNVDGGALPAQIGALKVGGYAVGYTREGGTPLILVAGLDIGEAHLDTETIDPGDPTVRADQVVDRATLRTFVEEARDYVLNVYRSQGRAAFTQVKSVLRDPNGPWKHGPVYLFIMEPTGYTIFHGAFPDKFEFRRPTDTLRDEVTGDLILPQIIRTATTSEDGGFVRYFFDDPDDDSDSADVPKVTYALQQPFEVTQADGSTFSYPLIFGAGLYGDMGALSEKSVAAARGWLARFGRAVGSHAVEMISSRMNSPAQGGAKMTLGGQTVRLDEDSAQALARGGAGYEFASLAHRGVGSRGLAHARTMNRLTQGESDSRGSYREMTLSRLLRGGRFHMASTKEAAEASGSQWSIWGRGAQTSFEGGGDAAIEGDVTTAMLGMDFEKGNILAGVALSRASGDGGFENDGRSEMEATLTSVHPYLRYAASERLSMWGVLGLGQGEMTLDETDSESGEKFDTDIEMRMGAFGLRGDIAKMGGFDLAVKSDVLLTQMDADAKDGLESISAEATRLRVLLETSRKISMEGGGTFRPSVEAGLRHDGGDVDEGLGVEVGGSLRFTNPGTGLTLELKARGLITHEEEDVADWGVGGMIRIAPGKAGRGLSFKVEPSVGETASGSARLWGIKEASRLAREEIEDLDPRVRAEVGYGLDAWGGLLTPYAGLSVSDSGNGTYRVGGRFKLGERLSMNLEGDVRERVNADPVHGVALRGSLRW